MSPLVVRIWLGVEPPWMRTPSPCWPTPEIDTSPVLLWMLMPVRSTVACVLKMEAGSVRLPLIRTEPPGPASPSAVVRVSMLVPFIVMAGVLLAPASAFIVTLPPLVLMTPL